MTFVDAAFVVVNYRSWAVLQSLLRQVQAQRGLRLGVVCVDNSGELSDDDLRFLDDGRNGAVPWMIIRPGNVGYGAGNNAGIEAALAAWSPRYAVVSNPDIALIDDSTVERLCSFVDDASATAVCAGPNIETPAGAAQNPYMLNDYTSAQLMIQRLKHTTPVTSAFYRVAQTVRYRLRVPQRRGLVRRGSPTARQVFAVHGAFLVLHLPRMSALNLLPAFDSRVFLFGEENVLARRVALAGGSTWYLGTLRVVHMDNASSGETDRPNNVGTFAHHFASKALLLREYYR